METQVLTQLQTKHSHRNPDVTQSFIQLPRIIFVFDTPVLNSSEVSSDSLILK